MAFKPRPYRRTTIPRTVATHVGIQRFSGGYTPALNRQVVAAGGFSRWFARQLADGYSDSWYHATSLWWPSINQTPDQVRRNADAGLKAFWQVDEDYRRWVMARRIGSQRQVREVMAEFWEHHFHVPASGEVGPYRVAYGKAIRAHALGRFDRLLETAVIHPAMAIYLTNANSTKQAPNENLGRELLELHTVGRGHFSEADVVSSARILTGYRVGLWRDWAFSYEPAAHWTGRVRVMDFEHANAAADGRPVVTAYLRHLAHHPATARHIATKLARRFVADVPPPALVTRLARVYLANDTDIRPVLRELISSREFARSRGKKVRTPVEDVVATWRALGARPAAPMGRENAAANAVIWQASDVGLGPFAWQRPDGRPDTAEAWSSTSRFLASLAMHYTMAGGWWPDVRVQYRRPAAWLPARRIRFDHLVDHLSRTLLGRGSTALLLQVACQATGCRPAEVITARHAVVKWGMPRLLTVFLDSPQHMTR